ncbi:MAG TPA: LysR family transcriptional regulator, partial [Candidatus Methylomirabilis sp.]|nr:LysR family transcriptional regulator [Candidatus Methylomirabilis sp.]
MDVNLAHLRTLRAVVGHGSFSRAAESLHLSQPAVSLHIRQLEERAGTRLLERVGKRAFPTAAGEILLTHASRVLGELETARRSLDRLRGVVAGRLRLGTGATASTYLLPPMLGRLRARYPALELVVVTGNSAEIAAGVASNQLDLGVVTLPVSGRHLAVSALCVDRLVAIARPGREWRGRRSMTAAELAGHPLILYERGGTIRRVIDEWLRKGHAGAKIAMELGNAEAIKKLVQAGLGLSVASAMSVEAERKAGTLVAFALDPPLSRRLGVVRRRDKPGSPALEVLLSALEALRTACEAASAGGSRRS